MQYITGKEFIFRNSVVALGKFDGLHLGHREIMESARDYGRKGCHFVVFTFDYHPNNLFSEQEVRTIYTNREKRSILRQFHPNAVIAYPFTSETASTDSNDFVKEILVKKLGVKFIVVGEDFRYGYQRKGDVDHLRRMGNEWDFQVVVMKKKTYQGEEISSTRIRSLLSSGEIEAANHMLGEPYQIHGEVAYGNQLGKKIFDTPTMNLIPDSNKLLPPNGVYASYTRLGNRMYEGVTNIGIKPTLPGSLVTSVETNLFHFDRDVYGKRIEVRLIHYIRPEKRFSSMEALKEQMQTDKERVRQAFSRPPSP